MSEQTTTPVAFTHEDIEQTARVHLALGEQFSEPRRLVLKLHFADWIASNCPSLVHVDGTRVQVNGEGLVKGSISANYQPMLKGGNDEQQL